MKLKLAKSFCASDGHTSYNAAISADLMDADEVKKERRQLAKIIDKWRQLFYDPNYQTVIEMEMSFIIKILEMKK